MKKYIIFMFAAAISVLASCKKEAAVSTSETSKAALSAYIIDETGKTELAYDGVEMVWSEGDKICVFKNNGGINAETEEHIHNFKIGEGAGSKHGRFFPDDEYTVEFAPVKGWWAYYPYDWKKALPQEISLNPKYDNYDEKTCMLFTVRNLATQEYGQNVGSLLPMMGVLTADNEVKFRHTCGIIRFRISNPNQKTLESIQLEYTGESCFEASIAAESDAAGGNIKSYPRYFTYDEDLFEYETIMKSITYTVNRNDEEMVIDIVAPQTFAADEERIDEDTTKIAAFVKVTLAFADDADKVFGENTHKSIIVTAGHIVPININL